MSISVSSMYPNGGVFTFFVNSLLFIHVVCFPSQEKKQGLERNVNMRAMTMLDQAQAQHNDMLRKRRILVQDKEKMGMTITATFPLKALYCSMLEMALETSKCPIWMLIGAEIYLIRVVLMCIIHSESWLHDVMILCNILHFWDLYYSRWTTLNHR